MRLCIAVVASVVSLAAMALTGVARANASTTIVAWGDNNSWQLGAGYKSGYSDVPVPVVGGMSEVTAIAVGYHLSLALLSDGTVRSWGGNAWGQLGDGSRMSSSQPVSPVGLEDVSAIAAGGGHALALLGDGTVMTWGSDASGTLGNGTTGHGREDGVASTVPVHVPGLSDVVAIAAGGADDFALLRNGTVVGWGENRDGQLGDGTTLEKDTPTPVQGLTGVVAISAGGMSSVTGHALALLGNGMVMAWGADDSGQSGNGTTSSHGVTHPTPVSGLSEVVSISAGTAYSLALRGDGSVLAWGSDVGGQLGVQPLGPELCGIGSSPCSKLPRAVGGLSNATAVSAGFRTSLALLSDGTVRSWGANKWGQLGDGSPWESDVPVADAVAESDVPVVVKGLGDVTALAAGEQHDLALTAGEAGPNIGQLAGSELAAPTFSVTPGVGSLTVSWTVSTEKPWFVRWRRRTASPRPRWGRYVTLPVATHSYTIEGLEAEEYEVQVISKGWGTRCVVGTPLPGPAAVAGVETGEPATPEAPGPATPEAPGSAPSGTSGSHVAHPGSAPATHPHKPRSRPAANARQPSAASSGSRSSSAARRASS